LRRLAGLGLIGASALGLLWLALRPNPEVARFLVPCAAPSQLLGLAPAWVIDTLGNIAVFLPVGALGAWSRTRSRWLWGTGIGLGLSLLIEGLQAFSPTRIVSWRDVMLNTLGAALGAGLVWFRARSADGSGRKP